MKRKPRTVDSKNERVLEIWGEYKKRVTNKNPKLKHLADSIYSDYIRITKSNKEGFCECITCQEEYKRDQTPTIQNGHFKSRKWLKYRYNDENCYPQCRRCNCALNGNYGTYMLVMQEKLGIDRAKEIREDTELINIKSYEYEENIIYWYDEIERLKALKTN